MPKKVMLRADAAGPFQRSEFKENKKGRLERQKRVLRFEPGVPVELNKRDLKIIEHELEVGLIHEVEIDEKGRPRRIAEQPDEPKEVAEQSIAEETHVDADSTKDNLDVHPFETEPEPTADESPPDEAA